MQYPSNRNSDKCVYFWDMDITQAIRQAITRQLNIEIKYRNSDKEPYKARVVSPHILQEVEKGNPILIARYVSGLSETEEKKPIYSYKVRNILEVNPTKFSFDVDENLRPRDKNLVAIASVFNQ